MVDNKNFNPNIVTTEGNIITIDVSDYDPASGIDAVGAVLAAQEGTEGTHEQIENLSTAMHESLDHFTEMADNGTISEELAGIGKTSAAFDAYTALEDFATVCGHILRTTGAGVFTIELNALEPGDLLVTVTDDKGYTTANILYPDGQVVRIPVVLEDEVYDYFKGKDAFSLSGKLSVLLEGADALMYTALGNAIQVAIGTKGAE